MGFYDVIRRCVFALDASDGDVLDTKRITAQPAQAPVHGILEIGEQREWLMGAVRDDGKAAWNHDGRTYCTPRATRGLV